MDQVRRYRATSIDLKQQEGNLPEAVDRFRELFENANDFIYTTDLDGNFTSINRAGERITGYPREELIGSNLEQIVAPESLTTVLRMMDYMVNGTGAATCELDLIAKDGRRVPIEVSARLITQAGQPAGLHGIARDISLRNETDQKIRQRAAHLEALNAIIAAADAAPDLPLLLPVAIDRMLEVLALGMGGIWVGEHHVVRGLSPEIGVAIVEAARGTASKVATALSVTDWNAVSPDGANRLASTWIHIGVRASLTVPILAEGRCAGALVVASAYPRPWTREEVALADAVAQQVAATAEGLRLFQEAQQHARLMGRLVALSDTLNRPSSVAGVVAAIGQAALSLSGGKGGAVYVRRPDGTFTCPWATGVSSDHATHGLTAEVVLPGIRWEEATAHVRLDLPGARMLEGANPALFPDVSELPQDDPVRRLAEQQGYRALSVWPMTYEGRVIAGVWCYHDAPHTWSKPEREVFQTFAWQAASALENARLYESQAERTSELEALYDLSSRLRATHTLEEILSTLGDHAARLLHADRAALSLLDSDHQAPVCVYAVGGPAEANGSVVPVSRETLDRVLQTGDPYATEDVAHELHLGQRAPLRVAFSPLGPVIVVALQTEREVIGTIAVGRTKGGQTHPFTRTEVQLLQGIAEMGGTAISRSRLYHNLEEAYIQMVLALAKATDAKDAYTGNHSERLATLAGGVAQSLGLPEDEVKDIRWAALLHDIGKIGSPDGILSKPGPLTEAEWAIMRRHPVVGEGILLPVARMRGVASIVRHHQEKWDGTGYPDGLQGEAIPLGARILAVVDAYSAMTDERPYKSARPQAVAEAELKCCAGTQFDPKVVEVFCQLLHRQDPAPAAALAFAGRPRC